MIEGFFDDGVPRPLPRVALAVSIPKLVPTPRVVKFVVDTGAMQSCVHPVDANQLLLIDRDLLAFAACDVDACPPRARGWRRRRVL